MLRYPDKKSGISKHENPDFEAVLRNPDKIPDIEAMLRIWTKNPDIEASGK